MFNLLSTRGIEKVTKFIDSMGPPLPLQVRDISPIQRYVMFRTSFDFDANHFVLVLEILERLDSHLRVRVICRIPQSCTASHVRYSSHSFLVPAAFCNHEARLPTLCSSRDPCPRGRFGSRRQLRGTRPC